MKSDRPMRVPNLGMSLGTGTSRGMSLVMALFLLTIVAMTVKVLLTNLQTTAPNQAREVLAARASVAAHTGLTLAREDLGRYACAELPRQYDLVGLGEPCQVEAQCTGTDLNATAVCGTTKFTLSRTLRVSIP